VMENLVLVDTNEVRTKELAQKFNVRKTAQDYRTILQEVDGAIIALPHHLHYAITLDFLQHGVHVLCEKPLAEAPKEAQQMVAQAQQSGVALAVNLTRRLFPAYGKIKELLAADTLGKLISIQYVEGHPFTWPTASGFYFKKASPTGVLLDKGAHSLDAICWWLGGKPTVLSSENDSFGGFEGAALVKLLHNGCAIELKLSWLNRLQNRYSIVGELGKIEGGIEEWDCVTIQYNSGKTNKIKLAAPERAYNDFGNTMLSNFIEVVTKGVKPLVPAAEMLASVELIDECYKTVRRFQMPWLETTKIICDGVTL
jgi:predicted dehydrogenase